MSNKQIPGLKDFPTYQVSEEDIWVVIRRYPDGSMEAIKAFNSKEKAEAFKEQESNGSFARWSVCKTKYKYSKRVG